MNGSYGGDEVSTTIMAKVFLKGVQFLVHGFDSQKKKKFFFVYSYRGKKMHNNRGGDEVFTTIMPKVVITCYGYS